MEELRKSIIKLFERYWDDDTTEEEDKAVEQTADSLIQKYGWDTVFAEVKSYLAESADTPEKAVNAAHIFWELRWYEKPIADPYEFLGFFYHQVEFETGKYDSSDILDSLTITIIPQNGFPAADLYIHPYYMPENDPEMIAAADRWKIHTTLRWRMRE